MQLLRGPSAGRAGPDTLPESSHVAPASPGAVRPGVRSRRAGRVERASPLQTFRPLTGRVVDEAQILSTQSTAEIAAKLSALEAKSSDQLVVFIAKSLQGYAIEDYGYQLGRAWGIGQKGLDNGVLLIVVPSERKVRIEVGRRLEPQLTDAMSTLIIENTILPAFREGAFADGITKGVQDIASVLLGDAEAVKQRAEAFAAQRRPLTSSEIIALFVVGA